MPTRAVAGFEPDPLELAELSALADDTLDPAWQAAVAAKIMASPELRVLYERERRVAGMRIDARGRHARTGGAAGTDQRRTRTDAQAPGSTIQNLLVSRYL